MSSEPKTREAAQQQAAAEKAQNQGAANTHTWDAPVREAYENERNKK